MKTTDLDTLERLLEAATKGPWEVRWRNGRETTVSGRQHYPICDTGTAPLAGANLVREAANAALIVAAINALPDLIRTARVDREADGCLACGQIFREGEFVLFDASGGLIHTACCGPEREAFVNAGGEPLGPEDPIPTGWPWPLIGGE